MQREREGETDRQTETDRQIGGRAGEGREKREMAERKIDRERIKFTRNSS